MLQKYAEKIKGTAQGTNLKDYIERTPYGSFAGMTFNRLCTRFAKSMLDITCRNQAAYVTICYKSI